MTCGLTHNSSSCCPALAHNKASVATPISGSACATPRHHQDIPLEEETMYWGTDADPGPVTKEAEISTQKVRETFINIIIVKISKKAAAANSWYKESALKTTCKETDEIIIQQFREIHWQSSHQKLKV